MRGKVVKVRFAGPTDYRGARWIVHADGFPRRMFPRDHALNHPEDALRAAHEYIGAVGLNGAPIAWGWYQEDLFVVVG